MIKIVIADASDAVRRALRGFFAAEPRFEIVGEASKYADTMALVAAVKADVLLIDVEMPGVTSRAEELAKLAEACGCPVILMSFAADAEAHSLAASTGVARMLDKARLYQDLIPAIEGVLPERRLAD